MVLGKTGTTDKLFRDGVFIKWDPGNRDQGLGWLGWLKPTHQNIYKGTSARARFWSYRLYEQAPTNGWLAKQFTLNLAMVTGHFANNVFQSVRQRWRSDFQKLLNWLMGFGETTAVVTKTLKNEDLRPKTTIMNLALADSQETTLCCYVSPRFLTDI